ncbi:MAG: hypothetical protein QXM55_02635 [Ignisphaera sp.]
MRIVVKTDKKQHFNKERLKQVAKEFKEKCRVNRGVVILLGFLLMFLHGLIIARGYIH